MTENNFSAQSGGKKLGFGLMRLPKTASGKIDIEETKRMVDAFMGAGFTYFDTAFVYDGGESEKAAKAALVDRYPRESFTLATKLCAWMNAENEQKAKSQFYISLERTGAGYFDYYLLHALKRDNYHYYDDYRLWDFVREQKEKGLIKNYGFSFHADPPLLDELLCKHPDVDFVQLQINYADWDNPTVNSRRLVEIAQKHNKPYVIMEPVKGGTLASPPPAVAKILNGADKNASPASWAIRFAASCPGVITVLSGMSNLSQMLDNISFMKDFRPLSDEERKVIDTARAELSDGLIPCTACRYCVSGCPKNIPIPEIFEAMNKSVSADEYARITSGRGKASDCISCGKCAAACPQRIYAPDLMKKAADIFGA